LELRLRDIQSQIDEKYQIQMIEDLNDGEYDTVYTPKQIVQVISGLEAEIASLTEEIFSIESELVSMHSKARLGEDDGISFYIKPEQSTMHKLWHIHCRYSGYELSLSVDGDYLAGNMPNKQFAKAVKWIMKNRALIHKQIKEYNDKM
jgi:hypothetical protein